MTSDCLLIHGDLPILPVLTLKIVLDNKCQNKNNFVSIFLHFITNPGKSSEFNKQFHGKSWKTYRSNR